MEMLIGCITGLMTFANAALVFETAQSYIQIQEGASGPDHSTDGT